MKSKRALLGVLAGVAASALLGLLFAPEKGLKTRKKISKKGKDIVAGFKEKFDDLLDSMTEKLEEAKESASKFAKQHGKA